MAKEAEKEKKKAERVAQQAELAKKQAAADVVSFLTIFIAPRHLTCVPGFLHRVLWQTPH